MMAMVTNITAMAILIMMAIVTKPRPSLIRMRDTPRTLHQLQATITIPLVRRIAIAIIPIPLRTTVEDHRAITAVVDIAADTPAVAAAAVVAAATAVAVLQVVTAAAGAAVALVQPAVRLPRPHHLPPAM